MGRVDRIPLPRAVRVDPCPRPTGLGWAGARILIQARCRIPLAEVIERCGNTGRKREPHTLMILGSVDGEVNSSEESRDAARATHARVHTKHGTGGRKCCTTT